MMKFDDDFDMNNIFYTYHRFKKILYFIQGKYI